MSKKNIGFVYYTPFAKANPNDIIDIEEYLINLSIKEDKLSIKISDGKYVSINKIIKHDHITINGAYLNYSLWEIHFIKSMIESPMKYDIGNNEISDISLSSNERIAEMNVMLYDPVTKIISISKNYKGTSPANIKDFINNIIDHKDNFIDFRPVLYDRDIKKLLNNIYSISFRVINTNHVFLSNYEEGDSISDAMKSINALKANIADDVQVAMTISLVDNRNHSKSFGDKIKTSIIRLLEDYHKGYVSKLHVTTDGSNGKKIDIINLIENTIGDSESFDISIDHRTVDPHLIFMKMVSKYNLRRKNYLQ